MKIVSLITARGGSKEIPKKNIVNINSKPLIWYSINASLNSNVNETWLSTDSKEIKNIAVECGAKVIMRPDEISTGKSQSEEALLHFADNVDFDILVFIQPTSPFISRKYINDGLEKMARYDSVFTVTKEHWLPKWDLNIAPIDWETSNRPMRQDKPATYAEAGMFYITTKNNLLTSKLRYSGKIGVVEIPLHDSFQIDSKEDLLLIKRLMQTHND
jgi:N-acylneuraminate cytidylyltransferase